MCVCERESVCVCEFVYVQRWQAKHDSKVNMRANDINFDCTLFKVLQGASLPWPRLPYLCCPEMI